MICESQCMQRVVNMKVVTIVVFPIASFFGLFSCHRVCQKCKWAKIKSHFHIFLFSLFVSSLTFFRNVSTSYKTQSRILIKTFFYRILEYSTKPFDAKAKESLGYVPNSLALYRVLTSQNTKFFLYIFSFPHQITNNLGRSHQNNRRYSPSFKLLNNSNISSPPRWP